MNQVIPFLTNDQAIFIVILVVAFYFLFTEKIKNELVAMMLIISLTLTGLLPAKDALSGFGSEPAIIAASIFVLSKALHSTGISEIIGYWVSRLAGKSPSRITTVLMLASSGLSAFVHHVAITAMLLPITLNLARDKRVSGSKLLIPISFAASLGTTMTIISAPAFLVASTVLVQAGRPSLGIFSITPMGLSLTLCGILFMVLIGRHLLPNVETSVEATERHKINNYFTELLIQSNSSLVGKTLAEVKKLGKYHFTVAQWFRKKEKLPEPLSEWVIQAGDVLHIHTTPQDLVSFQHERGLDFHPTRWFENNQKNSETRIAQAVVVSNAEFVGSNLREIDFRRRFGAIVIGFFRQGEFLREELASIALKSGDVLVIQGDEDALLRVEESNSFSMLAAHPDEERRLHKAPIAALIAVTTIVVAALRLIPVEIAMLAAAVTIVLSGCISLKQAYRAIDTRIYLFIAGAIPLGLAMQQTGTAKLLADGLQGVVGGMPQFVILFLLYMVVGLITQLMSDAATVSLFAPIAALLAHGLGGSPEAYVVTVAMASVTACITPTGHHGNLLVYGPGRYQFSDFVRVGLPLTIILGLVVAAIAPLLWPV